VKLAFVVLFLALWSLNTLRASDPTINDHFFTTALPEPDRAEVFSPRSSDFLKAPFFKLNADQAQTLASLWRAQTVGDNFGSRCDNPQYGIRFYKGDKMIACATICFGCGWIDPIASDIHPVTKHEGFDTQNAQAAKLAAFLKSVPSVVK
jgi:hypothetical protein